MSLGHLFQTTAGRLASKTALICGNEAVSYAELDLRARGVAGALLARGVRPGDRVGIHSTNSIDAVTLLLACFHAGLIAVPVNVRLKAAEVAYVLGHAQPVLCYSQPSLAPVAQAAVQECTLDIPIITGLPAAVPDPPAFDEVLEGSPALILYTSGTTARPKGVTHSHATLLGTAATMWPVDVVESATMMVAVPLMHASGLTATMIPGLLAGATLVLLPAFEPGAMLDHIERYQCTWGLGLPVMMLAASAEQERVPRNVSSLRTWVAGGDAVPVALQERFQRLFGIPLLEGLAMTESLVIAWNRPHAVRAGSVGTASENHEVRVLSLTGQPLDVGETGELAVRSPANFIGYWNDPAATAGVLHDGWLLTGDLGRQDAEGYIWFAGRRKEVRAAAARDRHPRR